MLTMADDESVSAALQAGARARGHLLEGAREVEILRAVRAVVDGEAVLGTVRRARRGRGVARRPPAVVDLGPCLPRSLRDHVPEYVRASVVCLRGETSAAGSPLAR